MGVLTWGERSGCSVGVQARELHMGRTGSHGGVSGICTRVCGDHSLRGWHWRLGACVSMSSFVYMRACGVCECVYVNVPGICVALCVRSCGAQMEACKGAMLWGIRGGVRVHV